jgi:predicted phage-related endonuclease
MNFTREAFAFPTEGAWLEARRKDVTSTEVAGLFDAGSYENSRTFFELYNIKAGIVSPAPFGDNERAKWGNRLEAAIAYGIAEDYGLIVEPFKTYMRIAEVRLGASFDFKVVGIREGFDGDESVRDMFRKHGPGIMEVKNIDGLQFKRNWIEDGDTIEATPQIEFQVAAQLEVADLQWSLIAPLVGGNTPKVVIRERDRELGRMICAKAGELWARIAAGTPPTPDFMKDASMISKLYRDNDGSCIDLPDNFRLIDLCQRYKSAGAEAKAAEERKQAAKAEILTIIQSAKSVTTNGFKISAGTNKESYRAYHREAGERWTISKSIVPATDIESTAPAFRNVRISETA